MKIILKFTEAEKISAFQALSQTFSFLKEQAPNEFNVQAETSIDQFMTFFYELNSLQLDINIFDLEIALNDESMKTTFENYQAACKRFIQENFTHGNLLTVGRRLGYFTDADEGLCHGVSLAWLEASFLHQEERFSLLLRYVNNVIKQSGTTFISRIQDVKEKVKQHEPLSQNEHNLIDVLAFFEKIAVYQHAKKYKALFNEELHQTDYSRASQLLVDEDVQGLSKLLHLSHSTVKEFTDNLVFFSQLVESDPNMLEIGIKLSLPTHSMALRLKKDKDGDLKWHFMDTNLLGETFTNIIPLNETEKIGLYIQKMYNHDGDRKRHNEFSIDFIATQNNVHRQKLCKILQQTFKRELSDKIIETTSAMITGDLALLEQQEKNVICHALNFCKRFTVPVEVLLYLLEKNYNPNIIFNIAKRQGNDTILSELQQMKSEDAPIHHPS